MSKLAIQYGKQLEYPSEYHTLAEMLIWITKQYPQHGMTFIDVHGKEEFLAYSELIKNAKLKLKSLYQKGCKPGDILILVINDSKDFYTLFWACIFGGIVVAPVNQPSFESGSDTLHKLRNIWNVLDKPSIVIEEKYRKYYQALQQSPEFSKLNFFSTEELESDEEENIYNALATDLAVLQFSSGSTGTPKGVKLTHKNIIINLLAVQRSYELTHEDRVFTWLPHTHDMGLFLQYLSSIISGCHIFIFSPMTFVRSPFLFLKKITEHKGTWFGSPNFGFDWMVKNIPNTKLSELDFTSLRFTLNGAEPISAKVLDDFVEKFSPCGFKNTMMRTAYGMAEATVCATVTKLAEAPKVASVDRQKIINENVAVAVNQENNRINFIHVGYPIEEISIRIADKEGKTLLENQVGEIQIKGPSVTSGYFNCDHLNHEMFDGEWLHTGDLGFIVDGSLVITGRMKDIIFVRGQNYFAHDLEELIFKHNHIQRGNLLIAGLFNDRTQKEELLVFVKHKSNIQNFLPIRQTIIDTLRTTLGIEITHVLPVKSIPKTTSGKLQRFNLRKCYENGDYEQLINEINQCIEDKKSDLERNLLRIWSEILMIPEASITVDDEFFALGGNSIKAFQLLDELSKYLNQEVDAEILVVCKTIRQIIKYLQDVHTKYESSTPNWKVDPELNSTKSIAITGMAFRFPSARTHEEFWQNLSAKKDCISKISERRKELAEEPDWNDWIGELENIDYFDNELFDISEKEAVFMDPQQRLVLETSYEALEDAGLMPGLEEERNIGVYSGISVNTYYQLLVDHLKINGIESLHQHALIGNLNNLISGLLSRVYNFTGPALSIDTACSSFLVALHHAVVALRQNTIQGAVVAGANILATPVVHLLSRKAGILSSTKHAKVFDRDADGSVLGEGVVVFYLEPLNKAIEQNKNIYAIIRGTAINNDGRSFGVMAPNPKGQYQVLLDAYADANLSPSEIDYVEVHGTGTTIGDPIEVNVLAKLFSQHDNSKNVGIGSVKTNIGHLLAAAGGAGLAKVLVCLKKKKLVPSLHLKNLNPALKLEKSPFYIINDVEVWLGKNNKTRKAGLSSFGLGGTNAHIVLEEWNNDQETYPKQPLHILTVSAKSQQALETIIYQTKKMLENIPEADINNLCFTRNRYRNHYPYRAAFVISNTKCIETFAKIKDGIIPRRHSAKVAVLIDNISCFSESEKILRNLQKYIQNTIFIVNQDSASDLLIEKINLLDKTKKPMIVPYEKQNIERKYDILLCLPNAKTTILSQNVDDKLKIINLVKEVDNVFVQWFSLLAELYVLGVDFNWDQIHPDRSGRIINLPAYPFQSKSFWITSIKEGVV